MDNLIDYKDISVLINYKKDNSYNDNNWLWIKKRYEQLMPEAEICITSFKKDCYNKSTAINNAAKKAGREIFIIADSNIVYNIDCIHEGIEMLKKYPWVVPFKNANLLNEQQTEHLLRYESNCDLKKVLIPSSEWEKNSEDYLFIVTKNHFESIGGFNENITEWGEETVDFVTRLNDKFGDYGRNENRIIGHLFYEKIEYPTYMPGINISKIYKDIYKMKRNIRF